MVELEVRNLIAQKLNAIAKEKGYKNWKHYTLNWMRSTIISDVVSKQSYINQAEAEAELNVIEEGEVADEMAT